MAEKIKVLVGCQVDDCAAEVSYHLDMVKMWLGEPVCQECYENGYGVDGQEFNNDGAPKHPDWSNLPPITLADLSA